MRNNKSYIWRLNFLIGILCLILLGLVWRIVYLGSVNRPFLVKQSAARTVRVVEIPAYRGMIKDRNGEPLAVSIQVSSVWINPKIFAPSHDQLIQLAKILDMPVAVLGKKVQQKKRGFVYLKRMLRPDVTTKIQDLGIKGVFLQNEYQRYYPEAESLVHVLGFTNIDDRGIDGLELAYDAWLRGIPGKKRVVKDRLGDTIADLGVLTEPQAGKDLVLSIDRRIQYLAYRALADAVTKYHAESGAAVVLSVKTGEILAMVNQPSCNPNNRNELFPECYRNRAVTDLFEPGSTLKTFSIASALESGKYTPTSTVNTNPGRMLVENHVVYDDEHLNNGILTVTGVLQKSSNIGVAKITLSLPPELLSNVLKRFGFAQLIESGFPGEVTGAFPTNLRGRKLVLATLAFGYGISVNALQLARSYAAIASNGVMRQVGFLKTDKPLIGKRVLASGIAKQVLHMLQSVVEIGGTGTKAKIHGYQVVGKTGTAHIASDRGYYKDRYWSVFSGIAPLSDPDLVVTVVIKNPRGIYYGGLVAAPVFARIMEGALRILNVPPDDNE